MERVSQRASLLFSEVKILEDPARVSGYRERASPAIINGSTGRVESLQKADRRDLCFDILMNDAGRAVT